jgi:putative FmdB family regulatory protein
MPTYEYECGLCDHRFDQYRAVADYKNVVCERCGSHQISIVIGRVGIVAYGSEFCQELGVEITGPKQRKAALKARGMIDIGDTRPSDIKRPDLLADAMKKPEMVRKVEESYQFFESNRGDGRTCQEKSVELIDRLSK